jgi:uncharacterized protein YkwD
MSVRSLALHPAVFARTLALAAAAASFAGSSCASGGRVPAETPGARALTASKTAEQPNPDPHAERYAWQSFTASAASAFASPGELAAPCEAPDAALTRVAARIAERELRDAPALEVAEVAFALRAEGAPYVWPRVWTLRGKSAIREAPARLAARSARGGDAGVLRCGIASAANADASDAAVAVVSAFVLADLEALPTRVRTGTWLDVRAQLLVPANEASVLVLGPRGAPHRVTAAFADGRVRARFRVDRPGSWLVQVLAGVAGGPRPVAEALVFADDEPSRSYAAQPAPGEEASSAREESDQLLAMLNLARQSEGARPLSRDARLDRIALEHAEAMRALGHIAHDAGDGTPGERARAAGVAATLVGENVAHARSAVLAHRALWASPSHRANLLEPNYDAVGIGTARGEDGSVWVSELFAKLGRSAP